MKTTLLLAMLLVGISSVTSYKILFFFALSSKSHRIAFDPVVEELAKRGNEVTVLSSLGPTRKMSGVKELPLVQNGILFDTMNITFFQGPPGDDTEFFKSLLEMMKQICRSTYEDPEVTKMLKHPSAFKFDVMVFDGIFNEFTLPVAYHLGCPTIVFSPGHRFGSLAWGMNIPHPPSYIPTGMDDNTDRMTFWERAKNTVAHFGFHHIRQNTMFSNSDKIIAEFLPNSPSIADLERKISFLIANIHPAIAPPIPSMPYSVDIGCVNCQPAKALPKDLEDFMQSSGDAGVIYFSLGTVTKGDAMPLDMRNKVIEAFAQLPQKILWKYEASIENLPKNVKLIQWAPQQDLLEHNKLRLFITHGGGLSISEAIYHKRPVLGFPLSADQWGNMAMAVQRGFAEFLDWRTFTVEDFLDKINLIIKEDRYHKAADHYSAILRDQPQPPAEKAAYWIEYVARHKGAAHLKSAAENLNFFQYFLLDVIGAILLAVLTVLAAICLAARNVYRACCGKKSASIKKKKN